MEPTVVGLISAGAIAALILLAVFLRYKFPGQITPRKLSYQKSNIPKRIFMVNKPRPSVPNFGNKVNMTRSQLLELARARARAQFNESHRNSLVAEMMETRPEVSERLEPVFFVFDESIKDCAVCTKEFNMHSVLPSVITVCGHQLCDVCVDRCLRDFARCPICSSPIFDGDVLRHYDLFQEKPKELPGCELV